MWYFTESDYDSRNVKDPTASTVHSHAEELSALNIFGREVIQNGVDNPSPFNQSGKVKISFRLHELSGSAKEHFLNAIGFDEIAAHLRSASQDETVKKANILLPTPEEIMKPTYVLRILTIEDYGTRGLVGPEHDKEKEAFKQAFPGVPHCFLGLCRTIGDSQKSGSASGGTHGFGKTVLWNNSRMRAVLVYSNLDQPYIEGGHEHHARFLGLIRLPGHDLDGNAYSGAGYLGNREVKLTRAFYDEAARERALGLGIPVRDSTSKGTTVIVVDFDDPDQSDDDEAPMWTIAGLRTSAERYFWPAIVVGKLQVDVGLNTFGNSSTVELAQPHLRSELLPFVELYKAMIEGKTNGNDVVGLIDINVPKGPRAEIKSKGQLAIGVHLGGVEDAGGISTKNTVALVRGAGMVVGYWRVSRRGLAAKDYCGMAWSVRDEAYDQEHLEKLLAWAEPVTHDNWTNNAEALKYWRASRPAVKQVRDDIVTAVSELTTTTINPEGDAAPLLAGMFPFGPGPEPGPEPRDISIEVVESPHAHSIGSAGNPQYGFTVKITVPQRSKFRTQKKPDTWKVQCSYGFLGEGRHRKVVEQVQSRFTAVRINNEDWQERADEFDAHSVYEGDVKDEQATYELKGETQPMDLNMASIAKHGLAVQVYRGYKE